MISGDGKSVLNFAAGFAAGAHAAMGQVRKYTGEPYRFHPLAVAQALRGHGAPTPVLIAAMLHDVLEDTSVSAEFLAQEFGAEVCALVQSVTGVSKPEDGKRAERKRLDREHVANAGKWGQSIKLADLIDNTKSIVAHDPKFARVYLAEKRLLLGVLTKGLEALQVEAWAVLEKAEKELGL